MRVKIAGFALAAVIGIYAIGPQEKARAATFSIYTAASTNQDGNLAFTLHGNDRTDYGHLDWHETEQFGFGNFLYVDFYDAPVQIERSPISSVIDSQGGTENVITYHVFNDALRYVVRYDDYPSQREIGFDFSLTLYQYLNADGGLLKYESSSAYRFGPGDVNDTVTVVGDPLSTVPLPASEPLFGAALLMLGGVAYACRCIKVATAR